MILRILVLQIIAAPLAIVLGKAALYWGGSIPASSEIFMLLAKGLFFLLAVHVMLVWPLHQFGSGDLRQMKSESLKSLILFVLISLPLLSFVILFSNIKNWIDLYEVLLLVGSGALTGALLFSKSEKPFLVSCLVSIPVFVGLFVLNDIMGPFATRVQYLSDGNYVIFLKSFCVLTAVCFCFFSVKWSDRCTTASDLLLALSLSVPFAGASLPFLNKSIGVKDLVTLPMSDLFWTGILFIALIARLRHRGAEIVVRVWSVGLFLYSALRLTQIAHLSEYTFADLHRLVLYFVSMIFLSYFAFRSKGSSSVTRDGIALQNQVKSINTCS